MPLIYEDDVDISPARRLVSTADLRKAGGFWYLASPYSKCPLGMENAFRQVAKTAAVLLKHGVKVYSPIAHSHPISKYGRLNAKDHDMWMALDRPFMDAAVGCLVLQLPAWNTSKGVLTEMAVFADSGKPVYKVEWHA